MYQHNSLHMGRVGDLDIRKTQFSLGGSVNSCQITNFSFLLPLLCTTFTKKYKPKENVRKRLSYDRKKYFVSRCTITPSLFQFLQWTEGCCAIPPAMPWPSDFSTLPRQWGSDSLQENTLLRFHSYLLPVANQ